MHERSLVHTNTLFHLWPQTDMCHKGGVLSSFQLNNLVTFEVVTPSLLRDRQWYAGRQPLPGMDFRLSA
jgi:hypothetical protein